MKAFATAVLLSLPAIVSAQTKTIRAARVPSGGDGEVVLSVENEGMGFTILVQVDGFSRSGPAKASIRLNPDEVRKWQRGQLSGPVSLDSLSKIRLAAKKDESLRYQGSPILGGNHTGLIIDSCTDEAGNLKCVFEVANDERSAMVFPSRAEVVKISAGFNRSLAIIDSLSRKKNPDR